MGEHRSDTLRLSAGGAAQAVVTLASPHVDRRSFVEVRLSVPPPATDPVGQRRQATLLLEHLMASVYATNVMWQEVPG
jgi:hypothetical protein